MSNKVAVYYSMSSADSFAGVWAMQDHFPFDATYHGLSPEDNNKITNVDADEIYLMGFFEFTEETQTYINEHDVKVYVFLQEEAIRYEETDDIDEDGSELAIQLDDFKQAMGVDAAIITHNSKTIAATVWHNFGMGDEMPEIIMALEMARNSPALEGMRAKYFSMGISREPFTLERWDEINDAPHEIEKVIEVGRIKSQQMADTLAGATMVQNR